MTCHAYKSFSSRKSGSFVLVRWRKRAMESTSAATSTQTIKDEDWGILQTISDALESWSERVCNLETICKRTSDFHQKVVNCLQGQLIDGLISQQDVKELEYAADLWQKLYITYNCKILGCEFSTRDVLTYLLELYSLKQISQEFFIEVALKLV